MKEYMDITHKFLIEPYGEERRRFSRLAGTEIANRIEIKPLGQQAPLEVKLGANLINISDGGLCLGQDIPWIEDQVLKLVISIGDWSATVPTLGEVRWVKRTASNEKKYMIGVQYLL